MNLFNVVREQFSSTAKQDLAGLLGKQPEAVASAVDDSIGAVLDGFSTVARDAEGRELLYEAVRYCDDGLVDNPATLFEGRDNREVFAEGHKKLAALVGVAQKDKMIEAVKTSAKLSKVDAEDVLGYVAPGVLGVLKRQIEKGVALDNPDGIGQMFLGEGDPKSVPPAGQHNISGGSNSSAGGSAATMSEESDTSWLFRYVLPFVLLGGLVLAGMKNCGNMAGKQLVAQQESEMQQELDGVRAEVDAAKGQVVSLQGEFDASKAELLAQADGLTSELDSAKANTELLEGDLETARAEYQAAQAEAAELAAKTEALNGELEVVKASVMTLEGEVETTKADLEIARVELQKVKDLPTDASALQGLLSSVTSERDSSIDVSAQLQNDLDVASSELVQMTAGRDEAVARNVEVEAVNADLQEQLAVATPKIAELQGQLESAAGLRTELQGEINATAQALEEEKSGREVDVNSLSAASTDLQGQLSAMLGMRDAAVSTLSLRDGEVSSLGEQVVTLEAELVSLQGANAKAEEEATLLEQKIAALNGELDTAKVSVDGVRAELASTEESLASVGSDLELARENVATVGTERDDLLNNRDALASRVEELMAEKDAAIGETVQLKQQIEGLTADLDASKASGVATANKLGLLTESFGGLQAELGQVTGARDEISTQANELVAENTGLQEEVVKLNDNLTTTQAALEKEESSVAELQAAMATLDASEAAVTAELDEANNVIKLLDGKILESDKSIDSLFDTSNDLRSQIDQAAARVQAGKDSTNAVRSSIEERFAAEGLTTATVDVIEDESAVAIVLGSGDLYGIGSASLSPQGNDILAIVGSVVSEYPEWRIDVEGHTDAQGIGAALREKYPTNWELSSARASATVRYLYSRAGIDADKMSARGFGETRPLDSNETSKGREKNRRVEVVLRR